MVKKAKVTKTINPLHFEDLEPHRFEDLVRRLLYGFRDWSNIEATGRSGADEGFDIRAWEKGDAITNVSEEGEEGTHSVDGRLWQVQGKREKTITPRQMRSIIKEGVDQANPPYGYILAAATNISKASYDAFREELRAKGVNELYFWGKDHLEDQLSLPQNDEILFTFFGLSLSPRRRSRIAELKFTLNNKNKILKLIFGNQELMQDGRVPGRKTFLLRDIKAEHYPQRKEYPDFDQYRRWGEYDAGHVLTNGVIFKGREWYAYLDEVNKQWDYSRAVDVTMRRHNLDKTNEARSEEEGSRAESFWRHLPRRVQAKLMVYGFVSFEAMLIIDEKGDPEYTDPHIFIDFGQNGPFQYNVAYLGTGNTALHESEFQTFERKKVFPESFPTPSKGAIYDLGSLALSPERSKSLEHISGPTTLYSFDDKLKKLSVGDLIRLPKKDPQSVEKFLEVTYIHETTVGAFLSEHGDHYQSHLQANAGREVKNRDKVVVHELYEVMLIGGRVHYVENRYY